MVEKLLQIFSLSCRHNRTTQPFTASAPTSVAKGGEWEAVGSSGPSHYVVCLDCGKKFAYDWQKMRMVR
ncbi:MAG TPA: hypothetical protein VG897_01945 [Terriglobales bacterium]|nr:hypothetical protein [Terriglobales bacterium]